MQVDYCIIINGYFIDDCCCCFCCCWLREKMGMDGKYQATKTKEYDATAVKPYSALHKFLYFSLK